MVTYLRYQEKVFRQVMADSTGIWIVGYENPGAPQIVSYSSLEKVEQIPPPEEQLDESDVSEKREATRKKRYAVIRLLAESNECITNDALRRTLALAAAKKNDISTRTVLRYYYTYLARGEKGLLPAARCRNKDGTNTRQDHLNMSQALNKYFYSPKKMPLHMVYELMLLDHYRDEKGLLRANRPTMQQFRYYYYKTKNTTKHIISREGIAAYTGEGNGYVK